MLDKFMQFTNNKEAQFLYITGPAGTGKTTKLKDLVDYCTANEIVTVVCAHTHKACDILKNKLSSNTNIRTTHSMLRKRPTINDVATRVKHIEVSRQHGTPEQVQIMFFDEFSQIDEADFMDITTACEDSETGKIITKVVFIGDHKRQLPPVTGEMAIIPQEPWWIKLTHGYRQAGDNELLNTLAALDSYIDGAEPQPLLPNKNFIRDVNLVDTYKKVNDSILLAFTNEKVEHLNAMIQGRELPKNLDKLYSPTTREHYTITYINLPECDFDTIDLVFGDKTLMWDSKYKTLEHLVKMPSIKFAELLDSNKDVKVHAYVFGHYQYKLYLDELKQEAADVNRLCEREANGINVKLWAQTNSSLSLAKRRARAWRNFLTFKECVICLDFPYAMTVHKSQGSTYKNVLIDTQDIYKCANRNFNLYLRLMYVAISRSSDMVYTN